MPSRRRREAPIPHDGFWLHTLGDLALYRSRGDDEPLLRNAKPLGVAAFLALAPDRSARRPHLARLLWPDSDRSGRLRSLRQALYYLTDRADRDLFRREDGVLTLRADLLEVDLWAFDAAVESGEHERAVELYGGPFLEGFDREVSREFRHWREAENERIWSGLKAAYRQLVADRLASGEPDEAVDYARSYRDLNPLEETPRRLLLRALVVAGREVEAVQEYQQYRTLLEEELGEEPSAELEARAREVRELMVRRRAGGGGEGGGDGPAGDGEEGDGTGRPGPAPAQPPSPAGTAAGGTRNGDGGWPARGLLAGLAAAVLLLAAAVWSGHDRAPPTPFRAISADVYVRTDDGPRQRRIQLREGRHAGVSATGLSGRARRAPGGRRYATALDRPEGLDLAAVDPAAGDTAVLTARPHDEHPLAWSPDGRRLLMDVGASRGDGRRYLRLPGVIRVESGRREVFEIDGVTDVRDGDWSPYGTRVALEAGRRGAPRDVWVLRADGGGARRVSRHPAPDGAPAWSPEADWIAFQSRRTGDAEVFVVRPDGSDLRQVTRHPAEDVSPVWLSPQNLGFVSGRGGRRDLWAVHLPTGERRRLTDRGNLEAAVGADLRRPARWIEAVEVRPDPRRVAPGEVLDLRARLRDAAGRPHAETALPVRWRALEGAPLAPAGGGGWFRVEGEGRLRVEADLGGWRADTVRAPVRRVIPRPAEVLASESWEGRPLETRWVPFGDPAPAVIEDATGRYGAVLTTRGDEHYDSGVASARAFPLAGGLTVELWARAPFTRPLYQALRFGLFPEVPGRDEPSWRADGLVAGASVTPDPPSVAVRPGPEGDPVADLPGWDPGEWHRYALQVGPGGDVWLLVDGRLRYRARDAVDPAGAGEAHLLLHGRSRAAEVVHGPVRVYGGPRYRFAERRAGETADRPDVSDPADGDGTEP